VHAYLHDDPYTPPPGDAGQPRPGTPNGMRLKITRHVRLLQPPDERSAPWLDLGLGLDLDLDRQALQPVARLKVKDFLSIKAAPRWAGAGGVGQGQAGVSGRGDELRMQAAAAARIQAYNIRLVHTLCLPSLARYFADTDIDWAGGGALCAVTVACRSWRRAAT
jgi:hypothetical protein